MIVFLIFDGVPVVLMLALAGLMYLTWLELRTQAAWSRTVKLWWYLLVFLTNVLGYFALRLYLARRSEAA